MGNFGLVDLETPKDALIKKSMRDGSDMILVFSDEFNTEGRTFYPGDDPYWEAEDLHYWVSRNCHYFLKVGSHIKCRPQITLSGTTRRQSLLQEER